MPGTCSHDKIITLAQHDQHTPCRHQRPPALDHNLERAIQVACITDRTGDITSGLKTADRLFEPQPAFLAPFVGARVVDRSRSKVSENDGSRFIVFGELVRVLLVGEVEIAPHLASYDNWHAEEAAHRRMGSWEAVTQRM